MYPSKGERGGGLTFLVIMKSPPEKGLFAVCLAEKARTLQNVVLKRPIFFLSKIKKELICSK